MTKRSKKKKKPSVNKQRTFLSRFNDGFAQKKPVLKFVLTFALAIILFYSLYFSDFFTDHISSHIISGQANVSSFLLNVFGFNTTVGNTIVSNGEVILDIKKGCDGIEPTVFFLIGVLLVPFSRTAKLVGLGVGLLVLSLLNVLRITGLFVVSTYWPESFDFLHLHGGFTLFFIVTIIVWIFWANWAIGHSTRPSHEQNIS